MKAKRLYQKESNSRLNLFVRSLILSLIMNVTCVLYCFVCLLASPLPLRFRWRLTSLWIRGMVELCKLICHIDYRVEGLRNVTKIKNGILMSKHQSAWETFFIQGNFEQVAMIVKRELLWFPFFGWALALLGPIAINRKDTKSAMQQIIQQGKRYLEAGRWVCVFPEGTRIPSGEVGKYRIGGARLAVATGYPIIPVAHNAGRCWPRRKFIKQPGIIRIIFGPPIDPKGKTAEEVLELTKNWIKVQYPEIISRPNLASTQELNKLIQTYVSGHLEAFKNKVPRDTVDLQDYPAEMRNTALRISYKAYLIKPRQHTIISLRFKTATIFSGDTTVLQRLYVMNYDLSAGKLLTLDSLFKPDSNYLTILAQSCRKQLSQRLAQGLIWMPWNLEGSEPRPENFTLWNLNEKGLLITYQIHQLTPYTADPQTMLIPYSTLRPVLSEASPITAYAYR